MEPMNEVVTEKDLPVLLKKLEQELALMQIEGAGPILDVFKKVIGEKAKDGTLYKEASKLKLGALIHNFTKMLTALQKKGPVVQNNILQAPGEAKDPSFYRAQSISNLTERQRDLRRRAVEADVVPEKETP
jgi:hypothetical protein